MAINSTKVVTPQDDLTYKIIGVAMAAHSEMGPGFSWLAPIHHQQVIAYLAASGLSVGLLINFGAASLETRRVFPPKSIQSSAAYQARKAALPQWACVHWIPSLIRSIR